MDAVRKLGSWLQDAYAIEQHTEMALQKYADATREYPSLHAKLAAHVAETRRHKERIESCLQSLGQAHSGFGSAVAKILGAGQTAVSALLGDAVLTNSAASYALEQLEVATYTSIVVAAEKAGRPEVARTCRDIMAEDEAMGAWLLAQLPQLTENYLNRPENGK